MRRALALLLVVPLLLVHPGKARADGVVGVNGCGASPVPSGLGAPLTVDTNTGLLCGPLGGNGGGYDSGPVQVSQTPANSSHAAGSSVGGLFTLSMARTNGGSGEVTQVRLKSSGASVGSYVVRIWDKSPAATTCVDNSAFVGSNADDANLITPPFTMTPTVPANTTGDANTYAAQTGTNYGFINVDTSPGKNLYACIVTAATDTADENKAVYVTMDALQN